MGGTKHLSVGVRGRQWAEGSVPGSSCAMTPRSETEGMIGRGVPRAAIPVRGVLVIAAKVTLSLPPASTQPALVAVTWAAVCSFVTIRLVLFRTSVPSANAWGCLLAAAATTPGDLAEGAREHVGLTPFGYLFKQVYLAATVALALQFPDRRLTRSGLLIVCGLLASAVGLRAVVITTSGPLPPGFHPPPGWRTLPGSAFVHDGAMRLSLVQRHSSSPPVPASSPAGSGPTAGWGGSPGFRSR